MKLLDLHENLYYGELNNLLLEPSVQFPGALPEHLRWKVGAYLRQSLTKIYSRFILLEKELVIAAQDEINLYYLQPKYAVQDATVMNVKYIMDTPDDPFLGDVLKIEQVFHEDGTSIAINNPEAPETLYTPKYDCLQIPAPATGNSYVVLYQADHPPVDNADLTEEIMVPSSLEMALRAHIASLIYSSMGGDHTTRGMELMSTYEEICTKVEEKDLLRTSLPNIDQKFEERGFI